MYHVFEFILHFLAPEFVWCALAQVEMERDEMSSRLEKETSLDTHHHAAELSIEHQQHSNSHDCHLDYNHCLHDYGNDIKQRNGHKHTGEQPIGFHKALEDIKSWEIFFSPWMFLRMDNWIRAAQC